MIKYFVTFITLLLLLSLPPLRAQNHADRFILQNDGFATSTMTSNPSNTHELPVTSLDITIPGLITINSDEEYTAPTYLYGFDKGDQIVIDLKMSNRKGSNNIEVYTYPDQRLVYRKNKFKSLENEVITVHEKSIFVFQITSNHTFDRKANLTLKRIPGLQSKADFNTNVSLKAYYEAVAVQSPQRFYVNSKSNARWKGGKNRVLLPINLPPNTVKWYFEYAATRDEASVQQIQGAFSLLGQLTRLIDETGLLEFGIHQISRPSGVNIADIYLLDIQNARFFSADQPYRYYTEGTRENYLDGVVEVTDVLHDGLHLGLKNPDGWHGVHIVMEVTAIVKKEGWVMEEDISY